MKHQGRCANGGCTHGKRAMRTLAFSRPSKPLREDILLPVRRVCFAPEVYHLLVHLCLRGIGMNRPGNRLGTGPGFHQYGKLIDHVTGMMSHNGGTEDLGPRR